MQSTPSSEYLYLVSGTISKLQNMQYSIWEEFVLCVFYSYIDHQSEYPQILYLLFLIWIYLHI